VQIACRAGGKTSNNRFHLFHSFVVFFDFYLKNLRITHSFFKLKEEEARGNQ